MSDDPMLADVRGWYIDGRRVHNPFASDAELVKGFDVWLGEHEAAIRRDQIESLIERIPRVDGIPVLGWMPVENWLRAQIGDTNEQ